MEKSKTKIRQILCWCKKRKTLLAFLAVMLFLSVSAAVIAYTQTAWPHGGDRHVFCIIDGPSGRGEIKIKAYCNTWNNKKEDKTKEVFKSTSRQIALSNAGSSGAPYYPQLLDTVVDTEKEDPKKNGGYSIITFKIRWTIPAHDHFWYHGNDKNIVGRFWLNNSSHSASIPHMSNVRTYDATYIVNLSNFGMVRNQIPGAVSHIHLARNSYTVKFGDMKTVSVACGGSTTAPTPNFWAYHKFNGWKCGNETVGAGGTTSVCGANKTFTAQWSDYYYNINYNSNGGGQATKTQKIDRNEAKAELMDDIFARTHYELTGWNTKPDGTGTSYPLGSTVNHLTTANTSTVTLYAQWRLLTHTVKFDGNGATSGQMADQFIDEGDSQELRANAFKRKGYYFCGWSTKRDGAAEYRDEETFTAVPNTGGQTTTLYAVWSRDGSFQVDNVTDDTSMFEGCDNLVGGNGTTYDYSHIDSKEANIDIPSDRGYFTAK